MIDCAVSFLLHADSMLCIVLNGIFESISLVAPTAYYFCNQVAGLGWKLLIVCYPLIPPRPPLLIPPLILLLTPLLILLIPPPLILLMTPR